MNRSPSPPPPAPVSQSRPTTLVMIEDNPVFLGVVIGFLERSAGERVSVVGSSRSGEEGVALATRLRPDIVTVDLQLPGMSGLDVIPALRRALPQVGIVVLSEHDEDAVRTAALTAGATEYVSKAHFHTHFLPAIARAFQDRPRP